MNVVAPLLLSIIQLISLEVVHAQTAEPSAWVELQVDEHAPSGSKPLKMTFKELERKADHSIVEVVFTSGASVPSSMFVIRGMCAVMRSRAERYFQSEPLESGPTRYKLTFPKQAVEAALRGTGKKVFTEQDCAMFKF